MFSSDDVVVDGSHHTLLRSSVKRFFSICAIFFIATFFVAISVGYVTHRDALEPRSALRARKPVFFPHRNQGGT